MEEIQIGEYKFNKITHHISKNQSANDVIIARLDYKQSRILELLVNNHRQIVSRETFATEVWNTSFVSDATINNKICALRKAFADNSKHPTYIKTHPQVGYELLAPVITDSKNHSSLVKQSEHLIQEFFAYFNSQLRVSIGQVLMLLGFIAIVMLILHK